jgi:hypothetical protein
MPYYNRNLGGHGGYNYDRGQNKPIEQSDASGDAHKELNINSVTGGSDQGASTGSGAPAIPHSTYQSAMAQGNKTDQVYVAKSTGVVQKGKKEKMFSMQFSC